MTQADSIKQYRKKVSNLFDGHCYICLKKFGKNFHFHHIEYRTEELKHSDFNSFFKYNSYVLPIIETMPDKFALLCHKCHRLLGFLQSIKNDSRFERLVDLSRRSRTTKENSK